MLKIEETGNEFSSSPLNVLLIEDDEDDFVIIRDLLLEIPMKKFEIKWVAAYDRAMEELSRSGYDVCLLDYRLGRHNGLELLTAFEGKGFKTPIIFLTGHGDYEVDIKAMKGGASDYVVKDGLTASLLERSIRYAIDRAHAREALQKARDELEQKVAERTAELARANEALRRHSEKIQFFAYSISHDLKSPAISLHGLAKRFKKAYGAILDEKGKAYCAHILRASEQIAFLVDKINDYISAKESPTIFEPIALKDICKLIREEFLERFHARKITWSEPETMPYIRADKLSIIRVLRNLVDNALKYGGKYLRRIWIGLKETEHSYILSVGDDGAGIRDEDSKEMFKLFKRKDLSRSVEGCGMGLAIVKEIAERHNGEVWVEKGSEMGFNVCISISKFL